MNLSKKNTALLCVVLALALAATAWAVVNKGGTKSPADIKIAVDLAALSGLSKETVLKLYDAVGDWDTVRQYIFVYKRVLNLAEENPDAYEQVFVLAKRFKADEMLAVYEFLADNDSDFGRAEKILAEHAGGTSLETVFTTFADTKTYKNYEAAGEEQIRQWLYSGYLPQDIINADSIARAKDMRISEVIALKTDTVTWEQIAKKLRCKFPKSTKKKADLKIQGAAGTRTVSAEDYETLVKQENSNAEKDNKELEEKVRRESGLTAVQIEVYKSQGFTIRDIQNAARLVKKSGTPIGVILQERKEGKDWQTIIKAYSGKEGKGSK